MNHDEMPGPARVVSAVLGGVFIVLGALLVVTGGVSGWAPVVGLLVIVGLGLDMIAGAVTGRWPFTALFWF